MHHRSPSTAVEPPLTPELQAGLARLLAARDYAQRTGIDPWQFAVAIDELEFVGLTAADLRWLILGGYIQHACEATRRCDPARRFQQTRNLAFTKRSCFVLTETGVDAGETPAPQRAAAAVLFLSPRQVMPPPPPKWDSARRELWLGAHLIKRFRQPCPNQERTLAAFEEEGWPPRIDDPLPPLPDIVPRVRLNDTIKSLNRHQHSALLHFRSDGTGQGVLWEVVEPASAAQSAPRRRRAA